MALGRRVGEEGGLSLRLSPWEEEWASALCAAWQVEPVASALEVCRPTLQLALEWIRSAQIEEFFGEACHRAVWRQDHLLGGVSLRRWSTPELEETGELGTWLLPDFWGSGVNAWVKRELLSLAFDQWGLAQVLFFVREDNLRALAAMRKLSFAEEADPAAFHQLRLQRQLKTGHPVRLFRVCAAAWRTSVAEGGPS